MQNLNTVINGIKENYKFSPDKPISVRLPSQYTDGCSIKFYDGPKRLASARIRFSNQLTMQKDTFDMFLSIGITDVIYDNVVNNIATVK